MTTPADVYEVRDPELPGRLLGVERDALLPSLRARGDGDFALPVTACPGWTVRDVLAHCSAALSRVVESRYEKDVFSPACNQRDIDERSGWTHAEILDELDRGMTEAGPVIAKSSGRLDALALGEWVHAGDVRVALGEPGAYAGSGLPFALALLAQVTGARGTCRCTPTWTTRTSRCGWATRPVHGPRRASSATVPPWCGCTRGARWTGCRTSWRVWTRRS